MACTLFERSWDARIAGPPGDDHALIHTGGS